MSFKNVMLSSVAALALLNTAAFAAIENDGSGDYLLMPTTYATQDGTWKTELKIVNTNTTHAVVARVVVRNGHDSSELFDFPIYLTPSDAWVGTLTEGTDYGYAGKVVVVSNDDSSMVWLGAEGKIQHADEEQIVYTSYTTANATYGVANTATGITDGRANTYVEVFGIAAYDANDVNSSTTYAWGGVGTPLDKEEFFEYVRDVREGTPKTQTVIIDGPLNDIYGNFVDVDNNSLIAKQIIMNSAANLNMAMNAYALGDISAAPMSVNVIGPDTTLARMTSDEDAALDTMLADLSKDEIFVMNEGTEGVANYMRVHFTDPTKKYIDQSTAYDLNETGTMPYEYAGDLDADGAAEIHEFFYTYNHTAHDMEENLKSCVVEGDNNDVSGNSFTTDECEPTEVYYEVQQINVSPTASDLAYIFPAGGFVTFAIDANVTIVPTTFSSSNFGNGPVNYHIENQYKPGTHVLLVP